MSYAQTSSRARDRLGLFGIDDILAVTSAVKGIESIASSARGIGSGSSTNLSDSQREARAAFFGQSALAGSITAAQYLIGGTQNTASHEIPYYEGWINDLNSDPSGLGQQVWAAAQAKGEKWAAGIPDPAGTTQMVNDVKQDLLSLGKAVPSTVGVPITTNMPATTTPATTGKALALPGMTTTAPYNYTPWLIGGGIGLAAVVLLGRRN